MLPFSCGSISLLLRRQSFSETGKPHGYGGCPHGGEVQDRHCEGNGLRAGELSKAAKGLNPKKHHPKVASRTNQK
jgi:hypothetical protein